MSKEPVTNKEIIKELNVSLDIEKTKKKDCLACKLTGSIGLFGISVYIFLNARKQKTQFNKTIINCFATGKLID